MPSTVGRVDLHIGVEKTGSSTLQRAFDDARPALAADGVLYPRAVGRANHTALAVIGCDDDVVDDLRRRRRLLDPQAVDDFRVRTQRALRREVEDAAPTRVVLSGEHCSSRLQSVAEVQRLADWLDETLGGELHVHVYLRRQDRMCESRHSTAVRAGVSDRLEVPGPEEIARLYDFELLLDRWAAVVGDDHLHPRVYERQRLVDGDIVADFAAALALPAPSGRGDRDANTALDAPTQEFVALLNRTVPRFEDGVYNPLHGRVIAAVDAAPVHGDPARFPTADARAFLDRLRPSNDAVAERWFDGAPLFDETLPDDRAEVERLDVERAVAIAGHVIRHVVDQLPPEGSSPPDVVAALRERLEERTRELERLRADADRSLPAPPRSSNRVLRALRDPRAALAWLRRRIGG